jgi:hypothetical protein
MLYSRPKTQMSQMSPSRYDLAPAQNLSRGKIDMIPCRPRIASSDSTASGFSFTTRTNQRVP